MGKLLYLTHASFSSNTINACICIAQTLYYIATARLFHLCKYLVSCGVCMWRLPLACSEGGLARLCFVLPLLTDQAAQNMEYCTIFIYYGLPCMCVSCQWYSVCIGKVRNGSTCSNIACYYCLILHILHVCTRCTLSLSRLSTVIIIVVHESLKCPFSVLIN